MHVCKYSTLINPVGSPTFINIKVLFMFFTANRWPIVLTRSGDSYGDLSPLPSSCTLQFGFEDVPDVILEQIVWDTLVCVCFFLNQFHLRRNIKTNHASDTHCFVFFVITINLFDYKMQYIIKAQDNYVCLIQCGHLTGWLYNSWQQVWLVFHLHADENRNKLFLFFFHVKHLPAK